FALARQCWQLEDQALAAQLVGKALDGVPAGPERTALTLTAFGLAREARQYAEAERLLGDLLADAKLARQPLLWRLASGLAEDRDMPAEAIRHLGSALDLEAP